jgi:hypothetical protein
MNCRPLAKIDLFQEVYFSQFGSQIFSRPSNECSYIILLSVEMDFIKVVLATGPNHWNALIPLQSQPRNKRFAFGA